MLRCALHDGQTVGETAPISICVIKSDHFLAPYFAGMMRFWIIFGSLLLLLSRPTFAQPTPTLLPLPAEAQWGKGRLSLKTPLRLRLETTADPAVALAARRTLKLLQSPADQAASGPLLQIRYGSVGHPEKFDEERYSLRVTPMGVSIVAPTSLGVLRALATLVQLPITEKKLRYLPEVDIRDQPRFRWRGLMIDAARHFMPMPVIKRNLDAMAAVKLNTFHWHLSDDQSFRVQCRTFPLLNQASTDGQFYTKAQVRDVLAYAAARGIRVVPEFDVPSHTTSWIVAYPRLASVDSVYAPYTLWRTTNVAVDPTRETTFMFIDSLFSEMTALFPDPYFHAGGDENDGRQWRRTPRIVQFMVQNCLTKADGKTPDKHQLQLYFSNRVSLILKKYGKTMVGWDEVLGPNLAKDVVIQSWTGRKGLTTAVKSGHPALLSSGYYLDLMHSAADSYTTDPLPATPVPTTSSALPATASSPAAFTPAEQALVLGGEAAMWAEFADSVVVESRIWPRAAAVAERLWSPQATTQNVPDMYRRMNVVSDELEMLGLHHHSTPALLLKQMAGVYDVTPLRTLAEVLEPVKDYKRHFQGYKYTTQTQLNRLVDAAPAESETARRFGVTVDSLLAASLPVSGTAVRRPALLATLRRQLTEWQANDARLQPLLLANPALQEYTPLSAQLSAVAGLLLARLDQLQTSKPAAPDWLATTRVALDAAQAPAGQAELAIVKAARRLVGL